MMLSTGPYKSYMSGIRRMLDLCRSHRRGRTWVSSSSGFLTVRDGSDHEGHPEEPLLYGESLSTRRPLQTRDVPPASSAQITEKGGEDTGSANFLQVITWSRSQNSCPLEGPSRWTKSQIDLRQMNRKKEKFFSPRKWNVIDKHTGNPHRPGDSKGRKDEVSVSLWAKEKGVGVWTSEEKNAFPRARRGADVC